MSSTDKPRSETMESKSLSRRNLLATTGAGITAIVTPAVVGASSSNVPDASERADRIHDQALEIQERTGSRQKFKRFLANNADHFQSEQTTFQSSPEGVSTQEWTSEAFATVDLTLTYYYDSCTSGDPFAYIDYYVSMDTDHVHGEGGPDQLTISWAEHHYRYEDGSAYHLEDHKNVSLRKEGFNGLDWEWEDGKACYLNCANPKEFTVGCKAQLLTTDQERAVQGSYWEMLKNLTVNSVSFTASGDVSFGFSTTGEKDQHGFTIEEGADALNGCI